MRRRPHITRMCQYCMLDACWSLRSSHAFSKREQLYHWLESAPVAITVLVLVSVDCVILGVQLMIDLEALQSVSHVIIETLHISSIVILSVFVVEVLLKVFAMGVKWLKSPWDVFDGTIVIVSWALDISLSAGDVASASSFLIVLRLWRVARIIHGFVNAAHVKAEKRVTKWKRRYAELQIKYEKLQAAHARALAKLSRHGNSS